MSDDQDHPGGGGDAGPERALDELRVALEQLATRMGAGFREDLAQIRAIATSVADRDLTADVQALRADIATLVGRDSSAELREDVAALRVEVARLGSADDVTTGLDAGLGPLRSTVERISAHLEDTTQADASADVLARLDAIAARFDQMPTAQQVSNLAGDLRAHLADALGSLDGDVIVRDLQDLRAQLGGGSGTVVDQIQDNLADVASGEVVGALWDEVRAVRAQLDAVATAAAETKAVTADQQDPDPQLAALADELAALREELTGGLVVEPSDALTSSLDALRSEVDGLRDSIVELRDAPAPEPVAPAREDAPLLQRLDAVQAGIDELRGRLDEGLVLADDTELPAVDPSRTDRADVEAIADQVAALRDFVASELDAVRQTVTSRIDAAAEATAATVAAARTEPEAAAQPATAIEADAVEALRDEIRAAGAIPDQVIESLRDELKALRRRIAVKASERVLDAEQLAQIADAVAARLAQDRA